MVAGMDSVVVVMQDKDKKGSSHIGKFRCTFLIEHFLGAE